jgi:alpha-L-fucosidase
MDRRTFLTTVTAAATLLEASRMTDDTALAAPPALDPYGPTPSPAQRAWHELELYGFVHFSPNTFTDREWGYGDEDPKLFNPTDFRAEQIVSAFKAGELKGLILTCKHHDGFCLWPTKTTEHSIKNSPYKGGKGDIVREFADACKKHGVKFGVYLSPWDRNHPEYGRPAYVPIYRQQLRELLTQYGPLFEVWHDGANGGDGYYGGAREKRTIDRRTYYDWPTTWKMVRELQPGAVIFSDIGPDIRWVGNERGAAGDPCWATYTPTGEDGGVPAPGFVRYQEGQNGHRDGKLWLPAECDVSIRPGWFWHAAENEKVKTPQELLNLYFASVGRGASFLLNIPPDRRGQANEADVASLTGFGDLLRKMFATDYARSATVTASNTRGGDKRKYGPQNVLDGKRDTFWATDDGVKTPEILLDLGGDKTFNVVRLREFLPLGQRIDAFAVDVWTDGKWTHYATGESIGASRLVRGASVTTAKVRVRITAASACPCLTEIALFSGGL